MLKIGPFLCFWKSHFPCRKKRIVQRQKKKKQKKDPSLALKTGPILLRNILGPVFNASLDHFLTLVFFCFFCVFSFFGGWTPYFYSVFSKNAKFIETQKRKKRHYLSTICEHNCANCSCQNVRFFFLHFSFCYFWNFHYFQRCFVTGFQNQKITKYQSKIKKTKLTTRKQDAKQK